MYRDIYKLILILLILVGFGQAAVQGQPEKPPVVKKGRIDLSRWNFGSSGNVKLKGEWRIFQQKLLTPLEIESIKDLEQPVWITVPGDWSTLDPATQGLPADGFATFTVVVKFPARNQVIGIRIGDIHTAYRLYVNETLLSSVGTVADNADDYEPGLTPKTVFFSTDSTRVRLTLQVANFSLPRGGPVTVLEIGEGESIAAKTRHRGYMDLFIFGLLAIMAFHHFGLYFQRRSDKSYLIFSVFCLVVALRTVLTGERTGFNLIPDWSIAYGLDILTIYLSLPLFYMFLKSIFPRYLSTTMVRITQVFAAINVVFLIFTPTPIYTRALKTTQLALVIFLVYLIYTLFREIRSGNREARWAAAGLSLAFMTIINDVLLYNGLIHTLSMTHFGVFAFILAQSYLLSMNFSKAFATAETYSRDLMKEVETRMEAQAKLSEGEKRFREMVDFLPIPVAEYDFNLNIIYANLRGMEMFGYSKAEYEAGVNAIDLVDPSFLDLISRRLTVLKQGQVPDPLELYLRKKDGTRVWGEIYPSLIMENNKGVGIRTCFVDLTDRREARRQLQQSHDDLEKKVEQRTAEIKTAMETAEKANQLKSEFLANISHELRNPMHQILSYSKYGIEKIDRPKPKLLHYFNQTRKAAERLMILLNDLLDLSKMESGRMEYTFAPCLMNDIIADAVGDFEQMLSDRNLRHTVQGIHKNIEVNCDAYKIGQVIRNLLANAQEFSPEGRSISVILEQSQCNLPDCSPEDVDQQCVKVTVKDQGVGIPEDELETIFDKFTQSSLTKTGAGGTGLGLAICREIVELHKGRIWAENNPDGGATISFCIPNSKTDNTSV